MRRAALILVAGTVAVTLVASTPSANSSPQSLVRDFACIHAHEGSWTDPNPPYYGGFQMDVTFMRSYGPEYLAAWGTADHWPPAVQLAVAMRGYFARGFEPWPNTARACGLIP